MTIPPYTLTNESITIVWDKKPHVVQKGSPQFLSLRKAIIEERWSDVPKHLTVAKSVAEWAKGKFTYKNDQFYYEDSVLPNTLNQRITAMVTRGENPTSLLRFWERLQKNPSWRSVEQLWGFLQHEGIPFTEDGHFLAYKALNSDFKDVYTHSIDNHPGTVHEMPRNKISDDPKEACHFGFHVGALAYSREFGPGDRKVVICKVDPADVVCVPYDSSQHKMRVCKYEVVGHHNGQMLTSTTYEEEAEEDEVSSAPEEEVEETEEPDDEVDDTDSEESNTCEECGEGIPDYVPNEVKSHYHVTSCSMYGPPDEEDEAADAGSLTRIADALGFDPDEEDGGIAKQDAEEKRLIEEGKKAAELKPKNYHLNKAHETHVTKAKAGVERVQKKQAADTEKRKSAKGWTRFDKLGLEKLLEQPIDELRKYAALGLKIIGASKIPGGKVALIRRILEVRE